MVRFVPEREDNTLADAVESLLFSFVSAHFEDSLRWIRIEDFSHEVFRVHVVNTSLLLEPVVEHCRRFAEHAVEVLLCPQQITATSTELGVLQQGIYGCGGDWFYLPLARYGPFAAARPNWRSGRRCCPYAPHLLAQIGGQFMKRVCNADPEFLCPN
jgi:hypothetical protein